MHKVVILTGSTKGLGFAASQCLAQEGYIVVGISRNINEQYRQLMADYPKKIFYYSYDFLNIKGISALVKKIIKEHGRPYALINNAALGTDGVLATMHDSDIDVMITVNIKAPILLTKYVSRAMLLNRQGRIINVGSIIGSTGFNGLSVYGSTKSSMEGFSRSLSRELGKSNITVNTLAPGYMETEMTRGLHGDKLAAIKRRSPLGRLVSVYDAAQTMVFLLSENASSITGTVFTVDAGSTA